MARARHFALRRRATSTRLVDHALWIILVNGRMQRDYRYELVAQAGGQSDPIFTPELTPAEMLRLAFLAAST